MSLLRLRGVFTAPVPDGWTVTEEPGASYLLAPSDTGRRRGPAEIRLAVFPRAAAPLGEHEGADRLLELLAELGVDAEADDVELTARYEADAQRALAWFPARDADRREVDCLAAVVVLPRALIAVTAMSSPRRSDVVSTAELLVASLADDAAATRR